MDLLKKIFPISFKYAKDVKALAISIIAYFIVGAVGGIVIWLASAIPLVGWIVGTLGGILDLYVLIGIVLEVIVHLNVIK